MKAVIAAGGKGSRLSHISGNVPKPMVEMCGKPVLEYAIHCLRENGWRDIFITTGHLGSSIHTYFGDGRDFGVRIAYFHEDSPLGTAGALISLREELTENFLLVNGDIVFDVALQRVITQHKEKGALATLVTHPNSHPQDSALIRADANGRVLAWLNKEDPRTIYKNRVNAGIHVLHRSILEGKPAGKTDLDRDLLKPLVASGRLFAYDTPEYIHDMGTPERYEAVCRDLSRGMIGQKNLRQKQKAVFLDRDGVINVPKGFINRWQDMELIPRAAEAIAAINASGYLAIVVTNQPVVARGACSFEELGRIHDAMETLLGEEGAYVDDIFVCPHHPDKGFAGEVPTLKVDCGCRKPKPGMLFAAAEKYNISLAESFMVGDHERDIGAGRAAGCKTVQIGTGAETPEAADFICADLYGFVSTGMI